MRHLPRREKRKILQYFLSVSAYLLVSSVALGQEAPLQLRLQAEKQVLVRNSQGQEQVSWQSLSEKEIVQPGDAIRYVVRAIASSGARPLKNFVLTQPIPKQTIYVLNSARGEKAKITYSIDNGKSFTDNPMIEIRREDGKVERQPAPASNYTHIRWTFEGAIAPEALMASYQVKVR